VSADSLESHRQFAADQQLNFPLIADPQAEIAARYGVPVQGGMFARVTYVIAADGTIAKVFPKVNPQGHADEVLAVLRGMPR
jgi:peroxiredoxin Q/BCP